MERKLSLSYVQSYSYASLQSNVAVTVMQKSVSSCIFNLRQFYMS